MFSCTEILSAVGCHGCTECRHGLGGNVADFGSSSKSSYHAGTKHVDGTLQDHGSDCCDGIV